MHVVDDFTFRKNVRNGPLNSKLLGDPSPPLRCTPTSEVPAARHERARRFAAARDVERVISKLRDLLDVRR